MDSFYLRLEALLGASGWSRDTHVLNIYSQDWTLGHSTRALAVAWPRSTLQVSELLKLCTELKIAVVPSGGRTGLAGGAVALRGELILSLEKLDFLNSPNLVSRSIRVGAGVRNEKLQEVCRTYGLHWPIDLASKGSATIGGNIATNAGGLRVIRYGHVRHWVLGLTVVLMDGKVLELNGELEKNNTGFDLRQLVIGSEGILGVVTEANLKLASLPGTLQTFLVSSTGIKVFDEILEKGSNLQAQWMAFEVWTRSCMEEVCLHRGFVNPGQGNEEFWALVEIEAEPGSVDEQNFVKLLLDLQEQNKLNSVYVAGSEKDQKQFWQFRENITESLRARGPVYKNDLSVPVKDVGVFVETVLQNSEKLYGDYKVFLFGHFGDGNIHVNVVGDSSLEVARFLKSCEDVNPALYGLMKPYGGSIAAEHGIGLLKKKYLEHSRSHSEIEIMKGIKKVWDPMGLLNPGKVFDQ